MYLLRGLHIGSCDITNSIYLTINIEVAVNGMCNFVVFLVSIQLRVLVSRLIWNMSLVYNIRISRRPTVSITILIEMGK